MRKRIILTLLVVFVASLLTGFAPNRDSSRMFFSADSSDLYIKNSSDNSLYFFNDDGTLYEEVQLGSLIPELFGNWAGVNFQGAIDHLLYFTLVDDDKDEGSVYEYDLDSGKEKEIYAGRMIHPYLTLCEDAIYIDDYASDTRGNKEYFSTKLKKSSKGKWKSESVYDDINELASTMVAKVDIRNEGDEEKFYVAHCMAKYGKAVISDGLYLYIYDEDGEMLNNFYSEDNEKVVLKAMDENYLVFRFLDEGYREVGLYACDLENDEVICLYDEEEDEYVEVLDFADGVLYTAIWKDISLGEKTTEVYAYYFDTDALELVCKVDSVPGHRNMDLPVLYAFKVFGNTAVYAGETDHSTGLLYSVPDGDEWEAIDPEITFREYGYSGFASVKCNSLDIKCDYCDADAYRYYYEYPVIKMPINNVKKINRAIADEAAQSLKKAGEYEVTYSREECEDTLHGEFGMCSENHVEYVDDVRMVDGRYVVVEKSGFDLYMHALRSYDYERVDVYDTETGTRVSEDKVDGIVGK